MIFELDAREKKLYREWNEKHLQEEHGGEPPYTGAAGGRVVFMIFPCGLGTFLSAECGVCQRMGKPKESYRVELTDFEDI